jgi:hypothetical protein
MTLSPAQRGRCLAVMDELDQYESFSFYAQPVDPVRDRCPDYPSVVAHPMDFGTVRSRLKSGHYRAVSDWKSDMSLIWTNSLKYNGQDSTFGLTALQLELTFKNLTKTLTDDESADWHLRFRSLSAHLAAVMRGIPPISDKSAEPRSRKAEATSGKALHGKKSKAERRYLTKPELTALVDQVNGLESEPHVLQVIELLRRYEPEKVVENSVDCTIEEFSPRTHLALRDLVNRLMKEDV